MRRLFVWVLFAIVAAGCSTKPTLAGDKFTTEVMGGVTQFDFGTDGSLKMDVTFPFLGKVPATGVFSETESALTVTLQRIDVPSVKLPGQAKGLLQELVGRPIAFKLTWVSEDEVNLDPIVMAGPFGQKMTLKRHMTP